MSCAELDPCCCPPNEDSIEGPIFFAPAVTYSTEEDGRVPLGLPLPRDVEIATIERRAKGITTWEISLFERSGELLVESGTIFDPSVDPIPLADRASPMLRMSIAPHGANQVWWHEGRGTAIVTATGVDVVVYAPQGTTPPRVIDGGEGDGVFVTPVKAILKVTGTPARSRRPSEIRVCDTLQLGQDPYTPFVTVPLLPGTADVWVDAMYDAMRGFGDDVLAFLDSFELAPRTWTPAEGSGGVGLLVSGPGSVIVRVVQRGRI